MAIEISRLHAFTRTLTFQASSPSELVWGQSVSSFAIVESLPEGISPCEPQVVAHGYTGEGAWYSYIEIRSYADKFMILSYCELE